MNIMMIEVGLFPPEEMKRRENYAKSLCSPNTNIKMVLAEAASALRYDFSMFPLLVPDILNRVNAAETEGFDAVIIDCVTDSGLEAAKMLSRIPVLGPSETSLHLSCLLADKLGWIVPTEACIPFHWRQAKNYGLSDRITIIQAVNMNFLEYFERKTELESKLRKIAKDMKSNGAQSIFIGCTAIGPNLGVGSIRKLSEELGIPILDPVGITIRTAEMMVELHLSHSKLTFPPSF
jgi:allantoin racemase